MVHGNVNLSHLNATRAVRAVGSHIEGSLILSQAELKVGRDDNSLDLDLAHIDGTAFLDELHATGEVLAGGANIKGQLSLKGARLKNEKEDGYALSFSGAHIYSDAFLDGLTVMKGAIRAPMATIELQLSLKSVTLCGEGDGNQKPRPINLRRARIGTLAVDDALPANHSLPPITAVGWQLGDVKGVIRGDRKAAKNWLGPAKAREANRGTFSAQPWHEMAAVYERNGQPACARYLRWEAGRRTTGAASWWSKPPRWLYGLFVGHGYYPLFAALWLSVAFLALCSSPGRTSLLLSLPARKTPRRPLRRRLGQLPDATAAHPQWARRSPERPPALNSVPATRAFSLVFTHSTGYCPPPPPGKAMPGSS